MNELRVEQMEAAIPLTFTARLCGHRRHQLLHAGAPTFWAGDLAAVVFADAEILLRLLAALLAFVFVSRHV